MRQETRQHSLTTEEIIAKFTPFWEMNGVTEIEQGYRAVVGDVVNSTGIKVYLSKYGSIRVRDFFVVAGPYSNQFCSIEQGLLLLSLLFGE